jgi:hypothetical protein
MVLVSVLVEAAAMLRPTTVQLPDQQGDGEFWCLRIDSGRPPCLQKLSCCACIAMSGRRPQDCMRQAEDTHSDTMLHKM